MRRPFKLRFWLSGAVLLAALVLPPTGARADMRDGVAAYRAGDYKTALREFTKLAEAGNPNAQFNLAVLYLSGRGVKRDVAKAIDWHRKAAEQGLASAEHGLGVFFYQGMGVKRDYAEALKWFKRAAAKGFAESEFNLGVMYFNRQGVKRDDIEVVKWITLAAARKFAPAQYRMGQMYEQGVIFAADPEAALHWYRLAEAGGNKRAAAAGARVAKSLNISAPSTARAKKTKPAGHVAAATETAKKAPKKTPAKTGKADGKKAETTAALAKPPAKPAPAAAPPVPKARPVPKAGPIAPPVVPPASPPTAPPAAKAAPALTTPPAPPAAPKTSPTPPAPAPKPAPKPPALQSDGWKNPFSLTPTPDTPAPAPRTKVETRNLTTSTPASPARATKPDDTGSDRAAVAKTAATGTGPGEWRVQFAAYRSAKEAKRALAGLNRRAGAAIGRIPRIIDIADLGARGIFHRIQAGPLDGPGAAARLCAQVKATLPEQACVPVQIRNR